MNTKADSPEILPALAEANFLLVKARTLRPIPPELRADFESQPYEEITDYSVWLEDGRPTEWSAMADRTQIVLETPLPCSFAGCVGHPRVELPETWAEVTHKLRELDLSNSAWTDSDRNRASLQELYSDGMRTFYVDIALEGEVEPAQLTALAADLRQIADQIEASK